MSISYDPDRFPKPTAQNIEDANRLGLKAYFLSLHEHGAKEWEDGAVRMTV
jgi:hypothetical protein